MTEASESPYNGLRGRGDSDGHAGAASGAMSRLCALGARHGVACGAVAHSADGLPKSTKRLITACYCGTQFVIGMIIGGVGAELPGLGRQTGTGLAEENMLMLARSVAYLCASAVAAAAAWPRTQARALLMCGARARACVRHAQAGP